MKNCSELIYPNKRYCYKIVTLTICESENARGLLRYVLFAILLRSPSQFSLTLHFALLLR